MSPSEIQRELAAAVARMAEAGPLFYTERQLCHEACRGLRPPVAEDASPETFAPAVDAQRFREALAEFARTGWPAGLLRAPAPPPRPPERRETDLARYGVPRVLLCQDEEVAWMLRANAFPLEAGCAVVALPRPGPLPAPLEEMVARARRSALFALHDASVEGLRWAGQVARDCPRPRGARLRAVGLRPVHARRLRLPAQRGAMPDARDLPPALAPADRAWLAEGWSAEVAAVHPARLLRALRRITREATPAAMPELAHSGAGYMTWP